VHGSARITRAFCSGAVAGAGGMDCSSDEEMPSPKRHCSPTTATSNTGNTKSPFFFLSFFAPGTRVRIEGQGPHRGCRGRIVDCGPPDPTEGVSVLLEGGETVVLAPLDVVPFGDAPEESAAQKDERMDGNSPVEEEEEGEDKENTPPAFTILPDEAGVIDDITRKRAEPQWTPLTELLTGEYQCAEVPNGMFKSSHGDFARGHMVRILSLKARAELNGSLGKLVRYDTGCERWHVQLLPGLKTLKVRPDKLEAAERES